MKTGYNLDAIKSIIDLYADNVDFQELGIEFNYSPSDINNLPPGTVGLMLGELLADTYHYRKQIDNLIESDFEKEEAIFAQINRTHPGPEHGPRRYYANKFLELQIPFGCELLDYGCGMGRYKEYYLKCKKVTALDANLHALIHLRSIFSDQKKYRLIWAPFGLTQLADSSFDCCLLSEVIGYVPDSISNIILDECLRLLQPGGKIILALVPERGVTDYLRGKGPLEEISYSPGSFNRKYMKNELLKMLRGRKIKIMNSSRFIVKLPPAWRGPTKHLYKSSLFQLTDRLINKIPGLSTWHLVVGEKDNL